MTDQALASRLWLASEALVGDHYVSHQRPDWKDFQNGVRGERSPDHPDNQ